MLSERTVAAEALTEALQHFDSIIVRNEHASPAWRAEVRAAALDVKAHCEAILDVYTGDLAGDAEMKQAAHLGIRAIRLTLRALGAHVGRAYHLWGRAGQAMKASGALAVEGSRQLRDRHLY